MSTERQRAIAELMSALSDRQFTGFEVSAIENCRLLEMKERKKKDIQINGKTNEGRLELNKRLAEIVNQILKPKIAISAEDIRLYKRCWADELTNRTGKCAWGFKEVREKFGYDPVTGLEK